MKKLSPAFLCVQVFLLGLFVWKASQLTYDNRVEQFAVGARQAEQRYREFVNAFGDREHFVVTLQFNEGHYDALLGERLLAQFRELDGVDRGISMRSLIPEANPKAEAVLPFPFFHPQLSCISGLFELAQEPGVKSSMDAVFAKAASIEGDQGEALAKIVIAGEPVVNYRLDESSREVKFRFFPTSHRLVSSPVRSCVSQH